MINIPPADRPRFEQAVCHLHGLGPRATGEAIAEIAERLSGLPTVFQVLSEFQRLTPAMLRATGGDRFPPRALRRVGA